MDPKDLADLQEVSSISPSFRGMSKQHIDALIRTARIERLPADHMIGREGEKSERLYLILKGDVDAFWGESLREVMVSLTRGGVFGGGLLIREPNMYSFATTRETVVASWDEAMLHRAELTEPGIRSQLIVRLSKHARLSEFADLLQNAPLFRHSSAVLRHRLLQEMTLLQVLSGMFVYHEGEPSSCCYLVVRGEVEVKTKAADGQERVTILGRGALFGDHDLLASGTRTESAEATLDTELLAIDRIDIEALRRACGSFRRAIAARTGSPKAASKQQEVILVVNHTPYSVRSMAALIPSAFADTGEKDVGFLEVVPEGHAGPKGDSILELPSDPARAINVLDERVQRSGHRYLIAYTEAKNASDWLTEPVWDKLIDNRISAVVFFTDDLRHTFPIETPQLSPVQYVEVRPSSSAQATHMVRGGSIRLRVDDARGSDLRYESLTLENRTSLQRLARTLARQAVGVALGGGAAFGYAHVALLRALHEAGIPIDLVAGTSMGAMVACTYGSRGLEGLDALVESGRELNLRLFLAPITRRPVESLFEKRFLKHQYLQDMPLPTFPVAVDIHTGRPRIFRHGRTSSALFASSSLPGLFAPPIQDGVRYVDGGMANNVPVSALVEEGADFIIASNVMPAPSRLMREHYKSDARRFLAQLSPLGRLQDGLRSVFLMMHEAGARQATAAQLTFAPALDSLEMFDFYAAKKIIEQVKPELPRFIEQVKEQYKAFCKNRDY